MIGLHVTMYSTLFSTGVAALLRFHHRVHGAWLIVNGESVGQTSCLASHLLKGTSLEDNYMLCGLVSVTTWAGQRRHQLQLQTHVISICEYTN